MASKTYRPKRGNEGIVLTTMLPPQITHYRNANGDSVDLDDEQGTAGVGLEPVFDREVGEPFVVGAGKNAFPYTTSNAAEQEFLGAHPALTDQKAPASSDGGGN